MTDIASAPEAPQIVSGSVFFEQVAPGVEKRVANFVRQNVQRPGTEPTHFAHLEIRLHCDSTACGGIRTYLTSSTVSIAASGHSKMFLLFMCQNCRTSIKQYALLGDRIDAGSWNLLKLGEKPSFGPPMPSRASSLLGQDRDLFLKGRRCESQGLGIAAFSYYRRVIENQRNRFIDEVIRVLAIASPGDAYVAELQAAKEERHFSDSVKHLHRHFPQILSVRGQNPLALLYKTASDGIHNLTDEQCLEYAGAVRTVLFDLAEKLAQVAADDRELVDALGVLSRAR